MPGRLAVDFGTSNTVLAVWDPARQEGVPLAIPDFSLNVPSGDEVIPLIPSLIHYAADQRRWVGNQVIQRGLGQSRRTFRWMKRYIGHRSPIRIQVDSREISQAEAGRDFLSSVLVVAAQETALQPDEEIALTVPIESYEHYEEWLTQTAEGAGMPRVRLIDEASAAALGYGAHIQPGSVYLIFDFGGGTLHSSVVLIEQNDQAAAGRRCRVLGKAGLELGGSTLDQWLYQETLRRLGRSDLDEETRALSNLLLSECERAKQELSFRDQAAVSVIDPSSGALWEAEFTRTKFEDLMDQNGLFNEINRTLRAALNASRERGYGEEHIQNVLMVGGSSQIPAVQRAVRQAFDRERVRFERPLDAVARGGAAFVAGVDFYDHIQHDYAIRFRSAASGEYDYRVIVPRGTPYPTREPVALLTIKATYTGQTQLGIAIFEMGEQRQRAALALELVFDPSGAARVLQVTPDEAERRSLFWMNESSPTFLEAEPPAEQGEPRFEVAFHIDANKRLLITARDLPTQRLVFQDYPVVKLS